MTIEHEIIINKFGQGLASINEMISLFEEFGIDKKRIFLNEMLFLIFQTKPKDEDIEPAILSSNLKPTFTPCVILKKGVNNNNLYKIINLPDSELVKAFILLLSLFKIAYGRKFIIEKNNPDKWWYWDLSNETNLTKIRNG